MSKANKQDYVEAKSSSVWFLLLSVTITTLYFKTESTDPFNTYKLIIILLSAGWMLGHLIDYFRIHTHESNLKFLKITIFSLVFISAMGVSLSFTDVFIIGLIGDNQRRNGFLAYLMLTVILLYAARSINLRYAVRLMKVVIITGIILSSYGILQINGKDFFYRTFNPWVVGSIPTGPTIPVSYPGSHFEPNFTPGGLKITLNDNNIWSILVSY